MTIFRIDDISTNTDYQDLRESLASIREFDSNSEIWLAISPVVFQLQEEGSALEKQRPFPAILNAHSDFRVFYEGTKLGLPDWLGSLVDDFPGVLTVSHGLVHVDHRLLGRSAVELSVRVSAAVTGSNVFVPPFNKWNQTVETVCADAGIHLVKWEDGWRHLKYQTLDEGQNSGKFYFHTHDFDLAFLRTRLGLEQ